MSRVSGRAQRAPQRWQRVVAVPNEALHRTRQRRRAVIQAFGEQQAVTSSPRAGQGGSVDGDLVGMTREQLIDEARRLRAGIRAHRDSTGHALCWHHPKLWGLLPE